MEVQENQRTTLIVNTGIASILAAILILSIMLNKSIPEILLKSILLLTALLGFAIAVVVFYYSSASMRKK